MDSEELLGKQREWAERVLMTTRNLLPQMSPVSNYSGWGARERQTISYLLTATARTSESAILLCAYGQLWEADVLVRSVLEGSMKLAYLLQAQETFARRHGEYADQLFDIAMLKGHRKAKNLLAAVPNPEASEWLPIRELLLSDDEVDRLSALYEKAVRRRLETRWGFTGLIGELTRSDDPYFKGLDALAHNYSMASHVQHVDVVGASIALERDRRSMERRDAIHLAHEGRLLSDLLAFLLFRMAVGYRFVGADMSSLEKVRTAIDEATKPFQRAAEEWQHIEYPAQK